MSMRHAMRVMFCVLAGAPVSALAAVSPEDLKKAAQLVERHYYESAGTLLRAGDPSAGSAAQLTLGRAYARNAELHRALGRSSLAVGMRYLKKLVEQGGRDRSRYAALYYGEYLIESGRKSEGLAQLRKFAGQPGLPASDRDIAQLRIAAAGGEAPAPAMRSSRDASVASQAAYALSAAAATRNEALAIVERIREDLRKRGEAMPMRAASNAVAVYARAGAFDKAFALMQATDLGRPSHEEKVGSAKTLRFYDPCLLGALAELYQGAAERMLGEVSTDARLGQVANYFLAESWFGAGAAARAEPALEKLVAAQDLPPAYRDRAGVLRAALEARARKGGTALGELARKYAEDPPMLAELLSACVRAGADCTGVLGEARRLAGTGQSERFRTLHWAVGLQHAAAREAEPALAALETARDKSNKNKIDTNDPMLLNQLADLYLETKSFSENLEIYFELAKEFPAVRQLQEAGQGVYSMEYRSAGDVKIF